MNTKKEVRELVEFASRVFEEEHKELLKKSKNVFINKPDHEVNFCVCIMPMSDNRINMFLAKPVNPSEKLYTKLELVDEYSVVSTSLIEYIDALNTRLSGLEDDKARRFNDAEDLIFINGVKYRKEC